MSLREGSTQGHTKGSTSEQEETSMQVETKSSY